MLLCNVSNQANDKDQDAITRPWRPLPSGRVTMFQAVVFRWTMVMLCIIWSASYGMDLVIVTLSLVTATIFHDEVGLANNPIGKNLCTVGGYTTFEIGATK